MKTWYILYASALLVPSVCLSVCLSVLARIRLKVKVKGLRSRPNMKFVLVSQLSENEVRGEGHQDQGQRSWSKIEVTEVKVKDNICIKDHKEQGQNCQNWFCQYLYMVIIEVLQNTALRKILILRHIEMYTEFWSFELYFSILGVIDPRKKFGRESLSQVRKILGCLKCKYENCIFIREW